MKAIDLFAGWGGFTLGAEAAGLDVVWAANHWQLAIDAHARNHPSTLHVCQDLRKVDWTKLPDYDVMLAAPACQGHSQAAQPARKKSGRVFVTHDRYRGTAFCVVEAAEVTRPKAIFVENVIDFLRWPLYAGWRGMLETLGYRVHEHVLRASHLGVPQRRDRLFVFAALDHSIELSFEKGLEPGFGGCIEWDSEQTWTRVSSATVRVRERIAKGRRNHGAQFLTQHVSNHPGVGLDEPIRTITTKDQWALVDGAWYRPLTVRECARGMGFPDHYAWPPHATRKEKIHGLGNAVCPPVGKQLVESYMEQTA